MACPSLLLADMLVMKNGERLTGKVIRKEGSALTFESSSAGQVKVKWDDVKELKTESPVRVVLMDGQVRECPVALKVEAPVAHEEGTDPTILLRTPLDIDMINPEPWRIGEGWQFSGRFNVALKYERGNNDKDEVDFDGKMTLRDSRNRFEISGELEHDRNQDVKTKDKWIARCKYDRFLGERLYCLVYAICEQDEFAELELRLGGGPGLGKQLYDTDHMGLLVEMLVALVHEEYASDPDEEYWGGGWRLSFERRLFERGTQFYFEHAGVWDIEKTSKMFTKTWTGVRVPLRRGITGTLEARHEYERMAAGDAEETDWTYRLKLGYEW